MGNFVAVNATQTQAIAEDTSTIETLKSQVQDQKVTIEVLNSSVQAQDLVTTIKLEIQAMKNADEDCVCGKSH